jgi:uncharacterized peroxidase-related enzyme
MTRLIIPSLDDSPAASLPALRRVRRQLGVVPNQFRLLGSSPAALRGYTALDAALAQTFDARTRAQIALAVAQANGSDYGLALHGYMGMNFARLSPEEIALNRSGTASDGVVAAAVAFAARVARERGHVTDADIAAVSAAGFSDARIVDIIALVAQNSFTNFLNGVAKTGNDFPAVWTGDAP